MAIRNIVTDHGAVSGGSFTVNRDAVQAAINACVPGDVVFVPNGNYTLAWAGGATNWSCIIDGKTNITIRGESRTGAILGMDPAIAIEETTKDTFWVRNSTDVVFETIRFTGNKPNPGTFTTYVGALEHHRAIFCGPNVQRATVRDFIGEDFTGDALMFYSHNPSPGITSGIRVDDGEIRYCQRNGITLTGGSVTSFLYDVVISNVVFTDVTVQPLDQEHAPTAGFEMHDCTINTVSTDYSITMAGSAPSLGTPWFGRNMWVHDNVINGGGIYVASSIGGVVVERNTVNNPTDKPCFESQTTPHELTICHNTFHANQTTTPSTAAIMIQSTGSPDPNGYDVRICHNVITTAHASNPGIRTGSVACYIIGNHLTGPGAVSAGAIGVLVRATEPTLPTPYAIVHNNVIMDYGNIGLSFGGSGAAETSYVEVIGNTFTNTSPSGPQTVGIDYNDGTNAVKAIRHYGNIAGQGVSTLFRDVPAGVTPETTPPATTPQPPYGTVWGSTRFTHGKTTC